MMEIKKYLPLILLMFILFSSSPKNYKRYREIKELTDKAVSISTGTDGLWSKVEQQKLLNDFSIGYSLKSDEQLNLIPRYDYTEIEILRKRAFAAYPGKIKKSQLEEYIANKSE